MGGLPNDFLKIDRVFMNAFQRKLHGKASGPIILKTRQLTHFLTINL